LSKEKSIPLSTLKLNTRILREPNLISFGKPCTEKAKRTQFGNFIVKILRDERDE
jgi:hypothetical protein